MSNPHLMYAHNPLLHGNTVIGFVPDDGWRSIVRQNTRYHDKWTLELVHPTHFYTEDEWHNLFDGANYNAIPAYTLPVFKYYATLYGYTR